MTSHRIVRGTLGVAATALLAFAPADAFASKEKFVRDKPHVNIGAQAQDDEEEKTEKGKDVRKEVQAHKGARSANENAVENADDKAKFKRSQGDEAGTLKGETKSRAKEKTDKSETARAKRR